MRIAVIGSGISGLVAAYLLSRSHDVVVFEAASHIGGHTFTYDVKENGRSVPVDMGFIVFNERTYPNFCRLMDELGVAGQESHMSFGVRNELTGLEYCGSSSLNELFAQRSNLINPSFYRMIQGILKLNRRASTLSAADGTVTLGQFLEREKLPRQTVDNYLIPMIAAIWSTDPSRMFEFPIRTLLSFLNNHGMLQVRDRPQWRVIRGGSREYVKKLTATYADSIHLNSPVTEVKRRSGCVELKVGGRREEVDAVVLAVHSDQALRILGDASESETEILGAIPYQNNDVVLHTDASLMPKRRLAWASWNYHLTPQTGAETERSKAPDGCLVTYWMNRLQSIDSPTDYLVSLNRTAAIDPKRVLHRKSMAHPLFLPSSESAKERWSEINRERTFFCGAYWGYGFHEDGVKSGLRVAAALGEVW